MRRARSLTIERDLAEAALSVSKAGGEKGQSSCGKAQIPGALDEDGPLNFDSDSRVSCLM